MRLSREQYAEFVEQEDRMVGLACYVVEREQGRVGNWSQNWGEGMKVAQEYEGHITLHQFNYAVLMQSSQTEAWQALAEQGRAHYRELFGTA